MNKRVLGNTGIEISEVGYGASALFGKDVLGKQGITEEKAFELISTAIKHGVTFFDTGINYGYAEERLGRCISDCIKGGLARREDLVIETKCGETINSDGSYGKRDLSPDWIKKSLEISLERLQLSYLDLFALHGECEKKDIEQLVTTFEDLKSQGLIRSFGVNTFNTEFLGYVADEKCFDYVMLDYNIMKPEREELILKLYENNIGVLAGAALGQSLYSKKVKFDRNHIWYFLRMVIKFNDLKKESRKYRFLTEVPGITANQLALRYVLDNRYISSAVFNTTSTDHLIENLKAEDIVMPLEVLDKLKTIK